MALPVVHVHVHSLPSPESAEARSRQTGCWEWRRQVSLAAQQQVCAAGALVAVLAKMGVACSANPGGSSNALPAVTVASITEVTLGLL